MPTNVPNLLQLIRTTDDVARLRDQITRLSSGLFRQGEASFSEVYSTLDAPLVELLNNTMPATDELKKEFFDQLLSSLEKVSAIEITLAVTPSQGLVEKLVAATSRLLGDGIVISFQVDPEILGGVCVSYNGKYYDQSLATKIATYLEKEPTS